MNPHPEKLSPDLQNASENATTELAELSLHEFVRHMWPQMDPAAVAPPLLAFDGPEQSAKIGIAAKRKRAGWKTACLFKVLSKKIFMP